MFSSRPEGTGSWHFQDSFIFIARFLETGIQQSLNKIACCVSCYICTHFLPRFSSFFRIFLKRSLTLGSSHRLFAAGCSCIASSENADGIWWNAIYCNSNCSTPNDGYIWLNDPNVFELHIWIHLDQIILSMIQYDTVKTWQKISNCPSIGTPSPSSRRCSVKNWWMATPTAACPGGSPLSPYRWCRAQRLSQRSLTMNPMNPLVIIDGWCFMGDSFYMFLYVFICFYKFLYVFICFYMFLVYFPIRIPKWEEINRIHWPNHEGLQVRSSISTHANFDIYDLAPVRWTKSLKSMWFLPGFLPSIPVVLHKAVAEVSKIGNL